MTSIGMTSHCMNVTLWRSFLFRKCEYDCAIHMKSFNTLRAMIYEISTNSHYFYDDPCITFYIDVKLITNCLYILITTNHFAIYYTTDGIIIPVGEYKLKQRRTSTLTRHSILLKRIKVGIS